MFSNDTTVQIRAVLVDWIRDGSKNSLIYLMFVKYVVEGIL